ncbi:MAG: UDP-N-acetylmuramate--L-alanine ligase [Micrococcaceae bacterium]
MTDRSKDPAGLGDLHHVHLLGIGGVGVSGIARIMAAQGVTVSGTDAKDLPILAQLSELGVTTAVGYDAANLDRAEAATGTTIDAVIASSIAGPGNPEHDAAVQRGIPVVHRSQGLAHTMAGHRVLAVAGTHGKTTTSSMAAMAFTHAEADPTFAVGAAVAGLGVNAAAGAGDWFIAEADESDGTLLNYRPEISIITNVEPDHLDHYGSAEAVHQVFRDFSALTTGTVILCADDAGAAALAAQLRDPDDDTVTTAARVLTYGESESADLRLLATQLRDAGQELTLHYREQTYTLVLRVPGVHNGLNAMAVLLAGLTAGLETEALIAGLERFQGTARRFETHGTVNDIRVIDDYAHHPTEVRAAIRAAKTVAAGARVHVIFQPHLFSRTRDFADGFAAALSEADTARVLEIYPARETPIPGVTADIISAQLPATYPLGREVATPDAAVASVRTVAAAGDIILTMGAGDVNQLAPRLLESLGDGSA